MSLEIGNLQTRLYICNKNDKSEETFRIVYSFYCHNTLVLLQCQIPICLLAKGI